METPVVYVMPPISIETAGDVAGAPAEAAVPSRAQPGTPSQTPAVAEFSDAVSEILSHNMKQLREQLREDLERGIEKAVSNMKRPPLSPRSVADDHDWGRRHMKSFSSALCEEEIDNDGGEGKRKPARTAQSKPKTCSNELVPQVQRKARDLFGISERPPNAGEGERQVASHVGQVAPGSSASAEPRHFPTLDSAPLPGIVLDTTKSMASMASTITTIHIDEGYAQSPSLELVASPKDEKEVSVCKSSSQTDSEAVTRVRCITSDGDEAVQPEKVEVKQTVLSPRLQRLWNKARSRVSVGASGEGLQAYLKTIVTNPKFESATCLLILANAVFLGVQTDVVAKNGANALPSAFDVLEAMMCVAFVLELALRIAAFRCRFFYMHGWGWNWFDVFIVSMQVTEQIMSLAIDDNNAKIMDNFSAARMIRMLKLVRLLRMARILHGIGELRILIISILNSVRSLFWTMVLLLFMIFTFSIYLTQIVSDHKMEMDANNNPNYDNIMRFYGSLSDTMFSMFMAISGGFDWTEACEPLMEEISPLMGLAFAVYIAFSLLAMLNVVTGVFVESVLKCQATDRDLFMVSNARELFQDVEGGVHGAMSWGVFESKLDAPQMQAFFKAIDVDPSEAKGLFRLLDLDGSGAVTAEEFLNGALRLRGHAKALDVALLIQEVRKLEKYLVY